MNASSDDSKKVSLTIISYVSLTFIGYFIIGLSLAVLPIFIHQDLGFSATVAGLVISLQYLTTFMLRGYSGKIVDTKGPKQAVVMSMTGFTITGFVLILAYYFKFSPFICLGFLIVTRLLTGSAEGMVGASPINWAILKVGEKYTATCISYNGVASYGGLAFGAPLGVVIVKYSNFYVLGGLIILLGLIGLFFSKSKENIQGKHTKDQQSFWNILGKVAPYGLCLALGGLGFATISTFMTLYYEYHNWENGALSLTVFGVLFILARLIFSNAIPKYGGIKVAIVSLFVEAIGLMVIWLSQDPTITLIGAGITGLGFSLVFPAMGVVAMKTVPSSNQGSALAGYGLFIDISLGVTGPLVGGVADYLGMNYIFPFSMIMVLIGVSLSYFLKFKTAKSIV